jgi:hypothetical protein
LKEEAEEKGLGIGLLQSESCSEDDTANKMNKGGGGERVYQYGA